MLLQKYMIGFGLIRCFLYVDTVNLMQSNHLCDSCFFNCGENMPALYNRKKKNGLCALILKKKVLCIHM